MAEFKIAHKRTSAFEGGYTNHPNDAGNWTGGKVGVGLLIGTNKGISAPVLKYYLRRNPTVEEMKNISDETVEIIYRRNYWNQMRGDEIKDQETANSIYDMCVNSGPARGIQLWQAALGMPVKEQSGKMDAITLAKTNNQ
ncbi:MAG: glycosyl hydrolase 108 family protein [Ferruginibacter sp.]